MGGGQVLAVHVDSAQYLAHGKHSIHLCCVVRNMNEREKDTRHGVESSNGTYDNKRMTIRNVRHGVGEW